MNEVKTKTNKKLVHWKPHNIVEIKVNTNKWGKVYVLEDLILPKVSKCLLIKCNPYWNPNDIFFHKQKKILKFIWNHKDSEYPEDLEKEEPSQRPDTVWLQNIL